MRYTLALILLGSIAGAAEWGAPVNGLQLALAVEAEDVVMTFRNTRKDREMFLMLGRAVGIGRAEFVYLYLVAADGARRQLQFTGGNGVAPGRLVPYIVPMMHGSTYTLRTPLEYWRLGAGLKTIYDELARGASLQAGISVFDSATIDFTGCFGLQIFWTGSALSKVYRPEGIKLRACHSFLAGLDGTSCGSVPGQS